MCWSGGRIHWDAKFQRPPQDWEQESFDLFMDMVYSSLVWGFGSDQVCWKPTRSRGFEVRGFYRSFYPPTPLILPLENDMEIEGSSKGSFLFMVCFPR